MYERWIKAYCCGCNSSNWLQQSDSEDLTAFDICEYRCWKCKRVFSLYDEEEVEDPGDEVELGTKKPY